MINEERNPLISGNNLLSSHSKLKAVPRRIYIFGCNLPSFITNNTPLLFFTLALCHILSSLVFAALQEKVTTTPGFKHPEFLTNIQTITYTLCSLLEISQSSNGGDIFNPKAPIQNYVVLSVFTFSGMYFTNMGLKFLSYPTRIIFKGAKPVPTMIGEFFYVGRMFSLAEVVSVSVLTLGITIFCYGEARGAPSFNIAGVLLMVLGVLFDSATSNYEKAQIFNHGTPHCEAMFFASLFGAMWGTGVQLVVDHRGFLSALFFSFQNPKILVWLFLSSVGGYLSVVFVLLLIREFSTTYAECVKGARKVCSIALSYLLLSKGKTFGLLHGLGILCFVASSVITVFVKYTKNKNSMRK